MKKKNFFTGSVFQFYIPEIKKFAFCKFFDFTHISKYHGLLAQIFDEFADTGTNIIDDLKDKEWICGARSMHKWPNLRKDSGWKSLGILTAPNDEVIPDFKEVQSFPYVMEDDTTSSPWYPVHQLTKRGENCKYEQVRHLERIILNTTLGLQWRAGMEYCRKNRLKVEDFYDFNDSGIKSMYYQMINVPVYKDIPEEIRGKAI